MEAILSFYSRACRCHSDGGGFLFRWQVGGIRLGYKATVKESWRWIW